MTKQPTTPDYVLKAVRRYDQKVKKVQIVFNLDKPSEAALYEAIEADTATPLSTLAKQLLMQHYGLEGDTNDK